MKKSNKDLLTGIKLGFLFIGTVIGAGFASGKEILVFFGNTGNYFAFACFFCGILFSLTAILFMQGAKSNNLYTLSDISKKTFKGGYRIFDIFIILCQMIVLSAMIAGVDSLFKEVFNFGSSFPLFSLFSLILCGIIISFGINGLLEINSVLVPVIIIFIVIIVITKPSADTQNLAPGLLEQVSLSSSIFSCMLYVGMNMLLAINVLVSPCKKLEKKQIFIGAIFGAVIIGLLMFIIGKNLFSSTEEILNSDMPLLFSTNGMPGFFRLICVIVIWCGIFTTMVSSMFPVVEYVKPLVNNKFLNILIVSGAGFLLSRIGFSVIVKFLFPVMGIVGVVFIIIFYISCRIKKKYKLPKLIRAKNISRS